MTLHRPSLSFRQPLAFSATLALALGGLFAATPAFAEQEASPPAVTQPADGTGAAEPEEPEQATPAHETAEPKTSAQESPEPETPEQDAPVLEGAEAEGSESVETAPPSNADVQAFKDAGVDLVGVGVNAAGETVVVTTGGDIDSPAGQEVIEEYASTRGDTDEVTTFELEGPVDAVASGDIVGGSGYIAVNTTTGKAGYCSLGFSAWSPTRKPAFITAGHCKSGPDDTVSLAATPVDEPAAGGSGTLPSKDLPVIGWFGFAQYGGPGGTPGTNGGADSIDIAVIDVDESKAWTLKPEVTDWTTPGQTIDSLAESTVKVERVGLPQPGPISRSGRTTGYQNGTVRNIDILDGWIQVSGRWVHGFSSETYAIPGDSGGSVIQGTTAVGIVSGVATDVWGGPFLWSSLLQQTLPATGGYEVALDIATPEIGAPEVTLSDDVAVSVPDNATSLTVEVEGEETTITPSNGIAIIPTPAAGSYDYTLTATNSMSRSEPAVEAVSVAPPAPGITSIKDGERFVGGGAPKSISGTGVEGATVEVTLTALSIATPDAPTSEDRPASADKAGSGESASPYTATVHNGTWTINLAPFGSEMMTMGLAATQTVSGVSSVASTLEFTVFDRDQAPPPAVTPPVKPAVTLAKTGGTGLAPMGFTAGAVLLLGTMTLSAAAIRRKNQAAR